MLIKNYIDRFSEVLEKTLITDQQGKELERDEAYQGLVGQLEKIREDKGNLYLVGNGGSSGIISHASVDFLNTCHMRAVPMTDNSMLTCFANDYGYENIFSKPLEKTMQPGDALLAVSSSGTSRNIVNAAETAKSKGAFVLTFSGFKADNPLRATGDTNFWLDALDYGQVELGHALLIHILTDELSERL